MAAIKVHVQKLKRAFQFFDLDNDGYITREEIEKAADKIASLSNCTEEEREVTRKEWTKWCDLLMPEGKIDLSGWIDRSLQIVTTNPEAVKADDTSTYEDMFEKLDSNKDGFISPEELRLYYKAFGYGDDYDIDAVFRSLDENGDGLLSKAEFVKAGVNFWVVGGGYQYLYDIPSKKK